MNTDIYIKLKENDLPLAANVKVVIIIQQLKVSGNYKFNY
jgi:hypothetical protein